MGSVSACAQPLPPLIDTWDRCMRDCGATGATKENGAATSSIMVFEMLENPIWSYSSSFDYLRGEA